MITIDDIVEKYRDMGSEKSIAENLRRSGLSKDAVKQALAQQLEFMGTAAEQQQQIEGYRDSLKKRPRYKQLGAYLSLFNSHERTLPLLKAIEGEPNETFWQVFLENWNTCDSMWQLRMSALDMLRRRSIEASAVNFLEPDNRTFFDSLPDTVTVYRGCGRRRVKGLPWSTDKQVALWFACGGRFSAPPNPVLASAEIARDDIFLVCSTRKESEVVLDPYKIRRLKLQDAS